MSFIGDPVVNAELWMKMIRDCPFEWRELVKLAFPLRQYFHRAVHAKKLSGEAKCFVTGAMAHDVRSSSDCRGMSLDPRFACDVCDARFGSNQALLQHKRKRHNIVSSLQKFVGSDATCPV